MSRRATTHAFIRPHHTRWM